MATAIQTIIGSIFGAMPRALLAPFAEGGRHEVNLETHRTFDEQAGRECSADRSAPAEFHCTEWDRSRGTCCPGGTVRPECPALPAFLSRSAST
jgi:hypothetical protein